MKRYVCLLAAPVVLTGLFSACGTKPAATNTAPAANANAAKPAASVTNTAAPATNTSAATNTASAPAGDDQMSDLTVYNKSKWAVHHLYMSPAKENEWGPDQLKDQTIEPGASFKLNKIPCNTYDIKVVDEDGDECVIEGEKFCGHEATWNLTNDELLNCEGYGEK